MRRLVISVTAVAILAGGAGVASAAGNGDRSGAGLDRKPHELCILIDSDSGPLPPYICLNW